MARLNAPNFTLDDDELHRLRSLSSSIPAFEVEGPKAGAGPHKWQHGSSADAFVGQDKEIASLEGFYRPWYKQLLFLVLGLLSGTLVFLLAKWSRAVHVALCLRRCPLHAAEFVSIKLVDGRTFLERVFVLPNGERLLEFRCHRYFYLSTLQSFAPVPEVPKAFNEQLQRSATALSLEPSGDARCLGPVGGWDLADRQLRYGSNEMRIPVRSLGSIVFDAMWHPFYVFQYFSVIVWCAGDAYYSYSVCIIVITMFSILTESVEAHRNMRRLAGIAYYACDMEVLRGGEFRILPSPELVPGDVVMLGPGVLPCDLVLLRGEVIADENMLTGESVPVRKVAYSPLADGLSYSPDRTAACTLYGGTSVAQARAAKGARAIGIVVRTRFYSAKGQLLRSILFPREHSASFISDSLKFIAVMLVACMGLFIWAAVALVRIGAPASRIVVRFFDMITIAVPPALPACLTIATVFSIGRLRKKQVYVTGPETITVAGQLDVICFDKTGTLTEQGLELQGIVPVASTDSVPDQQPVLAPMAHDLSQLPPSFVQLLATCHGLARLDDALIGDPLDQKLFAATGWELYDEALDMPHQHTSSSGGSVPPPGTPPCPPPEDGDEAAAAAAAPPPAVQSAAAPPGRRQAAVSVLRRFEFTSALQRQVVLVQLPAAAGASAAGGGGGGGSLRLFAKGSPEMIRTLVSPGSVPADFDTALAEYTREGFRVLALAAGDADGLPPGAVGGWAQEQLEQGVTLHLLGLAVMANPLRPDTAGVIEQLLKAQVRCAMVTGDHVRTAISVAHQCSILPRGRPVLLVDAAPSGSTGGASSAVRLGTLAAAGVGQSSGPFQLSVLYPDGSVNDGVAKALVLPQVLMGEVEVAVTGKGFDTLVAHPDADLAAAILRRGAVFARMSPDNKRDLVLLMGTGEGGEGSDAGGLTPLGKHVGFCGDGANDCGALKAAHVGVSLCEAEASVAAPMTSRHQSIAAMVAVVSEGRCTLMATYQIFQFIVGYAMAQAFATNLMYTYALQMGNYMYLIQDLFYITILAALMGDTEPAAQLARVKPVGRVLSVPLLTSTIMQLVVVVVFQTAALQFLHRMPGYVPTLGAPDLHDVVAPETTVVFLMCLAQFVILAIVFNKGHPHRRPLWTNIGLSVSMLLQVLFLVYSLFSVDPFTQQVEQLVDKDPPVTAQFRSMLLVLMAFNVVAAIVGEAIAQVLVRWYEGVRLRRAAEGEDASRAALLGARGAATSFVGAPPSGSPDVHIPVLRAPQGAVRV